MALISKEAVMVQDALSIALGHVDVLCVEQILNQLEKDVRDRCHHDFVHYVRKSIEDQESEEVREALWTLGSGLDAYGPVGLGDWRKGNCGVEDCPYQRMVRWLSGAR